MFTLDDFFLWIPEADSRQKPSLSHQQVCAPGSGKCESYEVSQRGGDKESTELCALEREGKTLPTVGSHFWAVFSSKPPCRCRLRVIIGPRLRAARLHSYPQHVGFVFVFFFLVIRTHRSQVPRFISNRTNLFYFVKGRSQGVLLIRKTGQKGLPNLIKGPDTHMKQTDPTPPGQLKLQIFSHSILISFLCFHKILLHQ